MFDMARQVGVEIPSGDVVMMRFPTEEEWQAYQRRAVIYANAAGEAELPAAVLIEFACSLVVKGSLPDGLAIWALAHVLRFVPEEVGMSPAGGIAVAARVAGGARVEFRFRPLTATETQEYSSKRFERVVVSASDEGGPGRAGVVNAVGWLLSRFEELSAGPPQGYGGLTPSGHKLDALDVAFRHVSTLTESAAQSSKCA